MADTYRRGTRTVVRVTAVLVARMHGLPRIGTRVGGGIHVPMPDVFTPQQKNIGWTSLPYRLSRRLHATNDDWGCLIRDETKLLFAVQAIRDAQLTPAQQVALNNAITASLALDATWAAAPDGEDDPTQQNGA